MDVRDRSINEEDSLLYRALEELAEIEMRNAQRKTDLATGNYYVKIIHVFGVFPLPVVNYGLLYRHLTLNNILLVLNVIFERIYNVCISTFLLFLRIYGVLYHLRVMNHVISLMLNSESFIRELLTFCFKSFDSLNLRRNIILENNESMFYIFQSEEGENLSTWNAFKEIFLNFISLQILWQRLEQVDDEGNAKVWFEGPKMDSLIFRFSKILLENFSPSESLWYMEILAVVLFIFYAVYLFVLFSMSVQNICISVIKKWDLTQLRTIFRAIWPLPGNLF